MHTTEVIPRFQVVLRARLYSIMKQTPPVSRDIQLEDILGHWPAPEDPLYPQDLDDAWLAGDWQQNEAFAEFTPEERLFIKRIWLDQIPEEQLRAELGLTEYAIGKKKAALKTRLARLLNRL